MVGPPSIPEISFLITEDFVGKCLLVSWPYTRLCFFKMCCAMPFLLYFSHTHARTVATWRPGRVASDGLGEGELHWQRPRRPEDPCRLARVLPFSGKHLPALCASVRDFRFYPTPLPSPTPLLLPPITSPHSAIVSPRKRYQKKMPALFIISSLVSTRTCSSAF